MTRSGYYKYTVFHVFHLKQNVNGLPRRYLNINIYCTVIGILDKTFPNSKAFVNKIDEYLMI